MKSSINTTENVEKQYTSSDNLSVRIKLHNEYSTNKEGLVPFLFRHYQFQEGYHILELGCGTGMQWENRIEELPKNCTLILSDFSEGMVEVVKEKYQAYSNVIAQRINIQEIPYPDESFDVVIANHMLYHVPDLKQAFQEMNRVLKKDGILYASTNGNGGLRSYLQEAVKQFHPTTNAYSSLYAFSLQNGEELLKPYFKEIKRIDYPDSLAITNTEDLINWMKSTTSISDIREEDYQGLFDYFEEIRLAEGVIDIPKEAGLFIARK